jgi:hypothetical protein
LGCSSINIDNVGEDMNIMVQRLFPPAVLIAMIAFSSTPAPLASSEPSAQAVSSRQGTAATAKDWPTYNCDVLGWRHNAGETTLSSANVGALEEK